MKRVLYRLATSFGYFIAVCMSFLPYIRKVISSLYMRCYTGFYSRSFNYFGKGSLLAPANSLHGLENVFIGSNVIIGKNITLTTWNNPNRCEPKIVIKDNTRIGENAHITCLNNIQIGEFVLTGRNLLITDNAHGYSSDALKCQPPIERKLVSKGGVIIHDGVWIGDNVCILPGVEIGMYSIIGANAVVTNDVPPFTVAVGNPIRILNIK